MNLLFYSLEKQKQQWRTSINWTDSKFGEILYSTVEKCHFNIPDWFARRSPLNVKPIFESNQSNRQISYEHIPSKATSVRLEDNNNLWFNQDPSRLIRFQHLLQICCICSWGSAIDSKFSHEFCKNPKIALVLIVVWFMGIAIGILIGFWCWSTSFSKLITYFLGQKKCAFFWFLYIYLTQLTSLNKVGDFLEFNTMY